MKRSLLLLIMLAVVLFIGAHQQAELTDLRKTYYEQCLITDYCYNIIEEQEKALGYAEDKLARQQERINILEDLLKGRMRIEIKPASVTDY